ncbi:hypothetical protein [Streptomyces sp. NPDC006691]|uniref:hypothetical protein n=1 Tax=Streptomyces sp. NPDC006691 TaxID=3364757 RepID=UPI0036942478
MEARAREVEEETGRRPPRVRALLAVGGWTGDDGGGPRREADYLVGVGGGLDHAALEWPKHADHGWFGVENLPRLKAGRAPAEHSSPDPIALALRDYG